MAVESRQSLFPDIMSGPSSQQLPTHQNQETQEGADLHNFIENDVIARNINDIDDQDPAENDYGDKELLEEQKIAAVD